ncbi:MAG: hypothetical protein OXH11_21275 [Candidatus Aminicenantes bacterium]|nr:hypothetical protein [Candidatus Aminicenantes bacterium]
MKRSGSPPRRGVRYEPPEKPPHLLSLGLGLQLVMLNISGIVLIPKIIIDAAGTGEIYLSWAVFAGLCVCGLVTIIQAVRIGRVGAGYILLMGTSGTFVAVSITALTEGGPALLATLIVVSSLFQFLLGSRLVLLRRVVTPLVAGTVIMLVAVTIMPIAFKLLAKAPAGAPPVAAPASFAVTLASMAGLALFATGAWRLWGPVLGVIAGCAVAAYYGIYDTARVGAAPWFGLPQSGWPGFDLSFGPSFWALLPVFIFVVAIDTVRTVGGSISIQQVSWRQPRATEFRSVQGTIGASGLSNLLSGLVGTLPNTTYSSSISVAALTGVAARNVGVCVGVLIIVFSFFPKATAVILAIPNPVVAAYVIVLISLLFVVGTQIVVRDGLDNKKSVVVGVAFWLGVGFQNRQIFSGHMGDAVASILENGIAAGGLAAIVMVVALELSKPRRRRIETKLGVEWLAEIDEFVRRFAKDKRWNETSTGRLRAATEEAILSLVSEEHDSEPEDARNLVLSLGGDRRRVELEFIAGAGEGNLEDRLALLGQWAKQSSDREFSLRLLRHFATSVSHRQYHDTDVVTVRVDADRVA